MITLKKHAKEALAAIRNAVTPLGCTAEVIGVTAGHYKVRLSRGEKVIAHMPISCTPAVEKDCINMCRQLARRLVVNSPVTC